MTEIARLGIVGLVLCLDIVWPNAAVAQGGEVDGSSVRSVMDIDYVPDADYADARDRLDVIMPEDAMSVPVVLFFHGGELQFGDKSWGHGLAGQLAARGIGVVSANYRLSPAVMHPAHLQDAAAAFEWTMESIDDYGGDPSRVFIAGHSAGGNLAALLSLDPTYLADHGLTLSDVRGTILISPFPYIEEPDVAPSRPKTVWGTDEQVWREASVTPYIGPGKPPMLMLYADGDDAWRQEQNERFAMELSAYGNDVDLEVVAERDHISIREKLGEDDDAAMLRIAEFVTSA